MDNFEWLSNWNKTIENINKITNPVANFNWINKIYIPQLPVIELIEKINTNNSQIYSLSTQILRNFDWLNNNHTISLINSINNNIGINIYTEVFEKIQSSNYWGNIAKAAILSEFENTIDNDELEDIVSNVTDNIDIINSNLEEINNNPIEFFNHVCLSIKSYIERNPSIKYSAVFIFWLISTMVVPLIIMKIESNEDKKSQEKIQVINKYTVNNNDYNSITAKINVESVNIKNFPRDKSKTVFNFTKNDEVTILKDSLKWTLIIKSNSIETGWIRKEFLDFKTK